MKQYFKHLQIKKYIPFILLYICIFLPIIVFRFPDLRNEIKYFVVTQEFLQNKNYFVLTYLSQLYPDKPPLYFWILGIAHSISQKYFLQIAIILGSTVPSFIIIVVFYKLLTHITQEKIARLATYSLILLPLFSGLTIFLRMDMLMTMFITIALYLFFGFYYGWIKINNKLLFGFYASIFLGIFTKGPAGLIIPLAVPVLFLILEKKLSFLRKIKLHIGLLFILFCTLLWFVTIYYSSSGKDYLTLMLGQETVGRIVKAKAHIKPFYYYLEVLPLMMFPYIFSIPCAIIVAFFNIKKWKHWNPSEKISFSWTVVPLFLFSLASGKLAVYMLPILPGATIFIYSFFLKNTKLSIFILKICNFLCFPYYMLTFFRKKKKSLCHILAYLNITIISIYILLIFFLNFYNKNYTVKPFISYLSKYHVTMYNFSDGENLKVFTKYKIFNEQKIQNIEKNKPKYILTKTKYGNIVTNLGYKKVILNKTYVLLSLKTL